MGSADGKSKFWWGFLGIVLIGLGGIFVWDSFSRKSAEPPLPILGRVDNFTLQDQNDRPLSRQDLMGKIWIADFIYTTCPDQCPMMSRAMQVIQGLVPKKAPVHLVSVSVDPKRDTPPVMAQYAQKYHSEPGRWSFLTGKEADILELTKSFQLPAPVQAPKNLIDHSQQLVLVDARSRIRGYYDGTNELEVKRLVKDVSQLAEDTVH
jgi:protein SCO1